VHEIGSTESDTQFIGLVVLKSLDSHHLPLPENLTVPATETSTLTVELSYMILPISWSKGYATESLKAVYETCKVRSFWTPFNKVYIRAIVNEENLASMRVMEKTGMTKRGVYEWRGEKVFLAGQWRTQGLLHVYGVYLIS
jgi:RimJ/RimL family protein N-acetyltransferase